VFGQVAAISIIEVDAVDDLRQEVANAVTETGRFHLAWNHYARWNGDSITREVVELLEPGECELHPQERPDSTGWGSWRKWAGESEDTFPGRPSADPRAVPRGPGLLPGAWDDRLRSRRGTW
jgi:hypothetical protein